MRIFGVSPVNFTLDDARGRQAFAEGDAALQLAALEREKLRCADRR